MKQANPSVAVVIPVYQATLNDNEKRSLQQCVRVLGKYPIWLVKPESLSGDFILNEYPAIKAISFEDRFFKSTQSYNELLISIDFYRRFQNYDYILIYQPDAYVFRDELTEWCKKGYDYIGAPSLHQEEFDSLVSGSIFSEALSSSRIVYNGGLSLRKVSAVIRYLKIYNFFYSGWKGNEDMLFSQEATRLLPMKLFLKVPPWQEALTFSFEKSPAASYELTAGQLPFACHAWERYDPAFWAKYIPQAGEIL
ncbi:hypothetical protein DYBT9275_04961 [Dyadobacter sp. CECT 9275]|uniref:DUF5672 domain-containing protein n=1 Tax=Dyadobacter helix TaxID=2822344 RepID=A0A916JJM6_9BACT|nr:DUF5672 family protein [Dyadobacter sp. CECT 9275]CAG5011493.1 hypothetical protein DYBT9275_04961 [Dyadobacter sp. CECT 9275]